MREDIQEYKGKLRIQWKNTECDKYVKEIWVAPASARVLMKYANLQRDSKEYNEIPRNTKEYDEIPRNTREYTRNTK